MAFIPRQSTTWRFVPSFFGTKKHGAAIGDVEGRIMPASSNSLIVSSSSFCSSFVSRYLLATLGSLSSHPSMKLILKFQMPLSLGIILASFRSKTSAKSWYSIGTPCKFLFFPDWSCSIGLRVKLLTSSSLRICSLRFVSFLSFDLIDSLRMQFVLH